MTHRHQRIASLWLCIAFAALGYLAARAWCIEMVGP